MSTARARTVLLFSGDDAEARAEAMLEADRLARKARNARARLKPENVLKARERARRWREKNPDRARENYKNWAKLNRDHLREYSRRYYAENPERRYYIAARQRRRQEIRA